MPHSCSPPWTSFRGCWKSAAHNLILVEVDDKHPWEVPICSWHLLLSWCQVGSHQKGLTLSDSMSCLAQLLPTSPRYPREMGLPVQWQASPRHAWDGRKWNKLEPRLRTRQLPCGTESMCLARRWEVAPIDIYWISEFTYLFNMCIYSLAQKKTWSLGKGDLSSLFS